MWLRVLPRPCMGLQRLFASTVDRERYRCLACGAEFEAPERDRVQCPECLGYRVEAAG
ncbi:hypothetical protein [Halosegnis marinus]